MRGLSIVIFAIIGFMSGIALGIALEGGFDNPGNSLLLGLLCATGFAILQCTLAFPPKEPRPKWYQLRRRPRRLNRRPRGPRQETEGSFSDRMERFATNVQPPPLDHSEQSKMPLWISGECSDLEPSPPKSISIIRMLLRRIRRVLTGK